MLGNIKKKLNREDGAVQIVEAAFVFPIMFIILFFLIYMGNAYYVKAQVESVVVEEAIRGANYCADPILQSIDETGKVPELSELDTKPYRYVFGGMDDVEKEIRDNVKKQIEGSSTFFKNMNPKIKTPITEIAHYNNYVVYSTFRVQVDCTIRFPISFLGAESPTIMNIKTVSEVAVNDTSEFIRNTDMVIDYFEDTKIGTSIKGAFDKINEFITSFAKK